MKSKNTNLTLDNYGTGLLIGIISRSLNNDSLAQDDIEKLKEIKIQLQNSQK